MPDSTGEAPTRPRHESRGPDGPDLAGIPRKVQVLLEKIGVRIALPGQHEDAPPVLRILEVVASSDAAVGDDEMGALDEVEADEAIPAKDQLRLL